MSNVIHVDFKERKEQNETMKKIEKQNYEATGLDLLMGQVDDMLQSLTVKPYALNKEKQNDK